MSNLPQQTRYLVDNDYSLIIQQSQKSQIIQNNQLTLLQMERIAIEEASSYILQKYDVDKEFSKTAPWDPLAEYLPGDRVWMNYPLWAKGASYNQYDCVIYNGIAYLAVDSIPFSSPQITPDVDTADWVPLGYQYSFYNGVYPYPEFDSRNNYAVGDQVYYKGYIYTCARGTILWNNQSIQQYQIYSQIPSTNVFPDDPVNNGDGQYWSNKTGYFIPSYASSPGTIVTDPVYWNIGDNRCQQMVMSLCDIAVYHLHRNIAPNNIPELRVHAYKYAIEWLEKVGRGFVSPPTLPLLDPLKNTSAIRYSGGPIKKNNAYEILILLGTMMMALFN